MREIEFRGKRKDNSEWVKGDFRHTQDFFGEKFEDTIHILEAGHSIGHLIIPETVGQYTGLKDKNGVKIFEGDILKPRHANLHGLQAVCWDDFAAGFMFTKPGSKIGESRITELATKHCAVVGNIHDNPELLKEKM